MLRNVSDKTLTKWQIPNGLVLAKCAQMSSQLPEQSATVRAIKKISHRAMHDLTGSGDGQSKRDFYQVNSGGHCGTRITNPDSMVSYDACLWVVSVKIYEWPAFLQANNPRTTARWRCRVLFMPPFSMFNNVLTENRNSYTSRCCRWTSQTPLLAYFDETLRMNLPSVCSAILPYCLLLPILFEEINVRSPGIF